MLKFFRKAPGHARTKKYLALQSSSLLEHCLHFLYFRVIFYFLNFPFTCSLNEMEPQKLLNKISLVEFDCTKNKYRETSTRVNKMLKTLCNKYFIKNNIRNLNLVAK